MEMSKKIFLDKIPKETKAYLVQVLCTNCQCWSMFKQKFITQEKFVCSLCAKIFQFRNVFAPVLCGIQTKNIWAN